MYDIAFDSRIRQSPVHIRYQLQGVNRIQIKDRCGSALETGYGIIAAHYQEISDACPIQRIKLAFYLVAVLIFAGKMNEGFNAQL